MECNHLYVLQRNTWRPKWAGSLYDVRIITCILQLVNNPCLFVVFDCPFLEGVKELGERSLSERRSEIKMVLIPFVALLFQQLGLLPATWSGRLCARASPLSTLYCKEGANKQEIPVEVGISMRLLELFLMAALRPLGQRLLPTGRYTTHPLCYASWLASPLSGI